MEKARATAAERKSKATAEKTEKEAAATSEDNLDKIEQKTKAADVAVEDGFDTDDI